MEDLISVIVPIYNVEKDLEKCIKSILNQTYTNLEIILVNDGSLDDSKKICDKYQALDNRISVINKKNEGVSVARNIGINKSKGKWITFVDGDDFLAQNMIYELYQQTFDKFVDIVCCCCNTVLDNVYKKNSFFRNKVVKFNNMEEKKRIFLQLTSIRMTDDNDKATAIGVPWGKLYRKAFLEENNLLFNKDLIRMQDNIFNMYAVYYARNIVYIDEPLYFYNIEHLKSISYKYNPKIDQLYNLILNERLKCFLAFDLLEDVDIKNAFCLDATSAIINVMRRKIFNPENKSNYFIKVKQLKNFLDGGLFSEIFKQGEIRKMPYLKFKIITFCLKYRFYYLFSFIYIVANKLNLI